MNINVIDLPKFVILDEMATNNLNKRIDDKFYNYYMFKDIDWLIKNKDKIINDFYSRDNKFERNNGYYPNINKFGYSDLYKERDYFTKILKDL